MDYHKAGLSMTQAAQQPSPHDKYQPCSTCVEWQRENQELRRINQSLVEQLQLLRELKANDDMMMGRSMNG